jgi:general stress protein CsbA
MNSIEEQLWNYIDGTCTPDEHARLSQLILSNEEYKQQYEELLRLNAEFKTLELDEPSMAFTYNVMEQIRTQEASVPLKAAINKKVIWAIGGFFVLTILTLLIYTLSEVKWTGGTATNFKVPAPLSGQAIKGYTNSPWMIGFLFFDVVLGLFLFDNYLRRRTDHKVL